MATKTPNHKLIKPDMTDTVDISMINTNWDTLDTVLKHVIEESGSNPNGRYIKFSDGTQMCWNTVSFSATFVAWGNLYAFDYKTKITYPAAFVAKPSVDVTTSSAAASMIAGATSDTTGITYVSLVRPNINNITYSIDYVAIGRWK